jgi:hypothetical protein
MDGIGVEKADHSFFSVVCWIPGSAPVNWVVVKTIDPTYHFMLTSSFTPILHVYTFTFICSFIVPVNFDL